MSSSSRICKIIARAGLCSRRDAEKLVIDGRVNLNGLPLYAPQTLVRPNDIVQVDGQIIATAAGRTRVFKYHKPAGLLTSNSDPLSRRTIFSELVSISQLPRVVCVGRLDCNSEGLLLLTNDGELARALELPQSSLVREYMVRVRTRRPLPLEAFDSIRRGMRIGSTVFAPMKIAVTKQGDSNFWVNMQLTEGKNREIRRIFESFGGQVSKLVRTRYGDITLGNLPKGDVEELGSMQVQQLKTYMDPELNDDDEESGKTKQKASKVRALRE